MYEFLIAERLRGQKSWVHYPQLSSEENINANKAMDSIHTPDDKTREFWKEIIKLEDRRGGLSKGQKGEELKVRPYFYL